MVSDYDAWYSSIGLAGGPVGDDDQDGHSNLEEYAFGLDPRSGASIEPFLSFPAPSTGTFTYTRRKRAFSGMDYTIWTSTDLNDWTEDTGASQATSAIPGTDNESVEVVISPEHMGGQRLFLRIQAR